MSALRNMDISGVVIVSHALANKLILVTNNVVEFEHVAECVLKAGWINSCAILGTCMLYACLLVREDLNFQYLK